MGLHGSPAGSQRPAIGIAYSGYAAEFLGRDSGSVDYVEVPYELLRHDPKVITIQRIRPIVLHCATLSIGGNVDCVPADVRSIRQWAQRTRTPWIGEHLAFITASRSAAGPLPEPYAPDEPYNIGYTVSPPMNADTLERVVANLDRYQRKLNAPLIIENSPLYFPIPTSTLSQTEFLAALCRRSPVGLLLDLAHWFITSRTMAFDPVLELARLPLERVVEVHISGVQADGDGVWDDHARAAPDVLYVMLEALLESVTPRAVTLEFNWSTAFPRDLLLEQLQRTREVIARANVRALAQESR